MNVPILRVPFDEDDRSFLVEGLNQILDSGILTLGRYTAEFEERFAAFSGTRYALSCTNATAALELILRGLGVTGRSVIVPTNTFLASAFAVIHTGNRVIFADSDPQTFALDVADVARRIEPDTVAVMLVHIGGVITPAIDDLQRLCRERGLYLIEDCAHAHGCSIDGRSAGTLGIAGAFSFFPTKVLTTGEGGMIATDDEGLYHQMAMLRNHGKNPQLGNRMSELGDNLRLSEITALLGVEQMRKAERVVRQRREVAARYDGALASMPGIRPLDLPEVVVSTYYKYLAYLDESYERADVKRTLKERYGVSLTGEVYADLCHTEPLWDRYTYCGRRRAANGTACPHTGCADRANDFPGAEYLSKHHVCLPLYPGLSDAEIAHVIDALGRTLQEAVRV